MSNPKDVLSLPKVQEGDDIRDHIQLCDEERWLMGFWINRGTRSPCYTVTKWAGKNGYWERKKKEIAENLHKIKHWKVCLGSYNQIKNRQATWFIDPPYQFGGENYVPKYSNRHIDFDELLEWCILREGQVIVCENTKADWIEVIPIKSVFGQNHTTTEAMWYREK